MRDLRFVGLDDAGQRLVLRDEDREYSVAVDDDLVNATRRAHGWHDRGSTGHSNEQADRQVDTATDELRPRDIQARVRAGESPEELAAASGVELERIARFARPVLQEREHVASAAQGVVVRTGALDGPLGEVVADRLSHVVDRAEPAWDAWRRDDGRWTVALTFRDDVQQRTARWTYDPNTNSVTVDDETARWLTEGTSIPAPSQPAPADRRPARARRLLSVPDIADETDATAAADDELAAEISNELAALGLQPVPAEVPAPAAVEVIEVVQVDEIVDDISLAPAVEEQTAFDLPVGPAAEEKPAKKARRGSKRASVPSWDDIVFGARKPTD